MAIDFSAANSEITIPSDTYFELQSDISWAMWVNVANFSTFQYAGTIYGNFFQTFGKSGATNRNSGYNFRSKQVSGVNYFGAWIRQTNVTWIYCWTPATDTYNTNTWYHICARYYYFDVGLYTLDLFVNGVLRNTAGGTTVPSYEATTDIIRLAYCYDDHWEGKEAEFAIWNVTLTDTEILQLYSPFKRGMPLQIQSANLLGYWPLDDFGASGLVASGANTIINRGPKGVHGTPVNSPTGVGDPISNRGRIIVV